jgi:methyl-accepting chemotaxis protein
MKNVKVGAKLIVSYILIVIISIGAVVFQYFEMREIKEVGSDLYGFSARPLGEAIPIVAMVGEMKLNGYRITLADNAALRAKHIQELEGIAENVVSALNGLKESANKDQEVIKAIDKSIAHTGNYVSLVKRYAKSIDDGSAKFDSRGVSITPEEIFNITSNIDQDAGQYVMLKIKSGLDMDALNEQKMARASIVNIALLSFIVIFAIGIGIYMTFSITISLKKVGEAIAKGEQGDMTARTGIKQGDEFGVMAAKVDKFFGSLQDILRNLKINSETLAGASEELSAISTQLASGSEESVSQSNRVAGTTEQMAVNINAMASGAEQVSENANEVAGAAEQMSVNMNTIAAAIEEMSASISQIAANASEARNVAGEATIKATDASGVMNTLGSAAKEIGQVTDVIKKIADKTNLLALNATIEAASAGEAGKGFAVVAGEIKELANQSAQSADDITRRIESIQGGTGNAVTVIQDVNDIIVKINQSVEAIAGHVEEQKKASNEIANNVSQANIGAKRVAGAISEVAKNSHDIAHNAGETAKGASNVSHNVTGMAEVAKSSAHNANQVNQSVGDLSKIASDLKKIVDMFKV